jgi:hypothetical protein
LTLQNREEERDMTMYRIQTWPQIRPGFDSPLSITAMWTGAN